MGWKEHYAKEQEEVGRLALLCVEKAEKDLTDEELEQIKGKAEQVGGYFHRLRRFVLYRVPALQDYRRIRRNLEKLPTDTLEKMYSDARQSRIVALQGDSDGDDLSDDAFLSPAINSGEYITHELLEERKKATS